MNLSSYDAWKCEEPRDLDQETLEAEEELHELEEDVEACREIGIHPTVYCERRMDELLRLLGRQ